MKSRKSVFFLLMALLMGSVLSGCWDVYGGFDDVTFKPGETTKKIVGYQCIGPLSITDYHANCKDTTTAIVDVQEGTFVSDPLCTTKCLWLTVEWRCWSNELNLYVDHDYPSNINILYIRGLMMPPEEILIKVERKK